MVSKNRYEEDDFAEDSVSLVAAPGRALFLPQSARRLDDEQTATLHELQSLGHQINVLELQADEVAREARELGISWSLIGFCLGLTGEAARKRYAE